MAKTIQAGGPAGNLYARANLVSKLVACHQHQSELVQRHKMCLSGLRSWLRDCSSVSEVSLTYLSK